MGLRDDQRELTRAKVVGAVLELLTEGEMDTLSVPAVSRRCGVSVATIYRHYPSRDDLLAAAAEEPSRRALASAPARREDDDDLAAFQRAMWTEFSSNMALLRHQVATDAGREMRAARLERSRRQLAAYIGARGIEAASPEGERLISLLLLVSGSLALVELHDRQGLDLDHALDASLWAVEALVAVSRAPSAGSAPWQPTARTTR